MLPWRLTPGRLAIPNALRNKRCLIFYQCCIDIQSTHDRWNNYANPMKPVNRTDFPAENRGTYPKDEQQNRIEHAVYSSNPKAFVWVIWFGAYTAYCNYYKHCKIKTKRCLLPEISTALSGKSIAITSVSKNAEENKHRQEAVDNRKFVFFHFPDLVLPRR